MDRWLLQLNGLGSPISMKQALSLYINKSCVHDMFSERPLNTDTQIICTLWHVPLVSIF